MRKLHIILLYTLLSLFSINITSKPSEIITHDFPKHEERAVWLGTIGGIDWPRTKATDPRSTERQKQELRNILDRLRKANINVVLMQTRIRGSVIYPSDIEPWDQAITGRSGVAPSYDPLQFAIEECHRRGMELHAWLVSIPLGTTSRQKAYGTKSIMRHHPSLCKTVGGEVFMQPGLPETADYIANLCREIVTRYDVDGISLDYIRYPESQYRFNDENLYKSQHSSLSLSDWRRSNITRIVRRIHDVVKPIKPWVRLSSSPIGKYRNLTRYSSGGWDCYNAVYQDPQGWLRDNIQDILYPMMYFLGNHYYPFLFDWRENSYGHPVATGLGIYFLDPHEGKWKLNDVRAQMHTARKSGIGGMAFYRSQYLTDNTKGLYDAACEEFFPYPALTSRMTWTEHTAAPAAPTMLNISDGTISWNYGSTFEGKWQTVFFNIYASDSYPVDITKAHNLAVQRWQEKSIRISETNQPTYKYFAVTAMDRYGNESEALQQKDNKPVYTAEFIRSIVKEDFARSAKVKHSSGKSRQKTKKTEKTARNTAVEKATAKPTTVPASKTSKSTVKTAKTPQNTETRKTDVKQAKTETRKTDVKQTKNEKETKKKVRENNEMKVVDFSKYLN